MSGLPALAGVRSAYLICSTPRSGSTLLCEALANTGVAGVPDEYFRERRSQQLDWRPGDYFRRGPTPDVEAILSDATPPADETVYDPARFAGYDDYLRWVGARATSANGVFAAKLMWGAFPPLVARLRELLGEPRMRDGELLAAAFPGLRYVWMTRSDKVRQAVSLWRAVQTWSWRSDQAALSERDPVYSFEAIDRLVDQIIRHERAWLDYFREAGVEPHIVVYERLAGAYEDTALEVLGELEIEAPSGLRFRRRLRRQADELSEQWVARYRAERGGPSALRPPAQEAPPSGARRIRPAQ